MKMDISQDANLLKHFIENLSAPKIWNLQNKKLGANRLGLWADALHGSTRLTFFNFLMCIDIDSL
jgi:hypothetical protein